MPFLPIQYNSTCSWYTLLHPPWRWKWSQKSHHKWEIVWLNFQTSRSCQFQTSRFLSDIVQWLVILAHSSLYCWDEQRRWWHISGWYVCFCNSSCLAPTLVVHASLAKLQDALADFVALQSATPTSPAPTQAPRFTPSPAPSSASTSGEAPPIPPQTSKEEIERFAETMKNFAATAEEFEVTFWLVAQLCCWYFRRRWGRMERMKIWWKSWWDNLRRMERIEALLLLFILVSFLS